nr:sulfatase/phosphatase domain-containing protein [Catalinimonas alkaloidigena]
MAPTICDYAAIENPPAFTGKSIKPILDNAHDRLREYLVVQLADDKEDSTRHGRMIRNRRYKYNLYNQGERNEQLFDLWKDPGETQNLAYEPNYQELKAEFKKELDNWIDQTNDDFYTWKK